MFDRLYVIHCRQLRERREHLETELQRLGWNAEWVVTFDPPDIPPEVWRQRVTGARLTPAEVSVYLKHLAVYRDLVEHPIPRPRSEAPASELRSRGCGSSLAFVIEDDAVFPPDFAATFQRYREALPKNFDAVFFGASGGAECPPEKDIPLFGRETGTRSVSGYLVTAQCAAVLLEELEKRPIAKPIDLTINDIARERGLVIYWSVPALIANGTETGLFPHSLGVRWRQTNLLARIARQVAARLYRKPAPPSKRQSDADGKSYPPVDNPEQLVLGIAHGFDAHALEPFVLSLRRSGFRGRCRILLNDGDRDAEAFLHEQGIEVELFSSSYARLQGVTGALHLPHRLARVIEFLALRLLEPLARASGPAALSIYRRLAPLHATALRYLLYRAVLSGPAGEGVRRVFLVDTRDVLFQSDPFNSDTDQDGVVGIFEEDSWSIGRCEVNSTWIRACYGEAELAVLEDRGIYCSGTMFGERDAVLRYLDAMVGEIARVAGRRFVSPCGFDQACHNHLLHLAPPAAVASLRNGEGPVIHLSHRSEECLRFSDEDVLIDDTGRVIPVVHQWDRHAARFAPALARLRE